MVVSISQAHSVSDRLETLLDQVLNLGPKYPKLVPLLESDCALLGVSASCMEEELKRMGLAPRPIAVLNAIFKTLTDQPDALWPSALALEPEPGYFLRAKFARFPSNEAVLLNVAPKLKYSLGFSVSRAAEHFETSEETIDRALLIAKPAIKGRWMACFAGALLV